MKHEYMLYALLGNWTRRTKSHRSVYFWTTLRDSAGSYDWGVGHRMAV